MSTSPIRRLSVAVVATITLLPACGSDGDGLADTVPTTEPFEASDADSATQTDETDAEGGPTSTSTTSTSSTTTESPPPTFGAFDAEAVILELEDLPAGWSEDPVSDEEEEEEEADCFDEALLEVGLSPDEFESTSGQSAERSFSQSATGPFLAVTIGENDRAAEIFDLLPDAFAGCDGTTDADGNEWAVRGVSFPKLGDETFATRIDIVGFFPVTLLFVIVRRGDVALLIVEGGLGQPPDAELVESSLQTMLDRL